MGLTCRHPDRHEPKMTCGYPIPCPYHTVTIDAGAEPPTVTIPVTSDAMLPPARQRLGQIAVALSTERGSVVVKPKRKRSKGKRPAL